MWRSKLQTPRTINLCSLDVNFPHGQVEGSGTECQPYVRDVVYKMCNSHCMFQAFLDFVIFLAMCDQKL